MSELVLIVDWETTGLKDEKDPCPRYDKGPQGIQIGAVVCDYDTWEIVGEFESNVRWLGDIHPDLFWSDNAYNVHKLSKEELSEAPDPLIVAESFTKFLRKHFDFSKGIRLGGHGVSFDRYFTIQLYYFAGLLGDLPFRFNHQELDTRTLGTFLWGTSHSDILFSKILDREKRKDHNALEDAKLTAEVFSAAKHKIEDNSKVVPVKVIRSSPIH